MKKLWCFLLTVCLLATVTGCGETPTESGSKISTENSTESITKSGTENERADSMEILDYIKADRTAAENFKDHPSLLFEGAMADPTSSFLPYIQPYLVKDGRTAVVIFTEGGQGNEVVKETALKLNEDGYSAFIAAVRRSTPGNISRAIRFVRHYQKEFDVKTIGAMSFGACAEACFKEFAAISRGSAVEITDEIDKEKSSPKFIVLGSPTVTGEYPKVDMGFPTMFVFYETGYESAIPLLTMAGDVWRL